jgi:heme-degrading monooxygenase HmoA
MYMRIVWGKIKEGSWDQYEEAYGKAIAASPDVPGRKGRWLSRDVDDPDAGYSVTLWESKEAMDDYYGAGKKYQKDIYPLIEPYFINQYTTTVCEVRVTEDQ